MEIFLTAIYGTLRRSESGWIVRLATGGHAPPIVRYANGVAESAKLSGTLIGVMDRVTIGHLDIHLVPGDALVFYTDGVHEARDGDRFLGHDGVVDIVRRQALGTSADALAGSIEDAALAINHGAASDDMAILVIAVNATGR
jgi:serine phosphatase RsbU (regulator of sigma subunit)